MSKAYSGLTAAVKLNGVLLGYINSVTLSLEREVATVNQFGAEYSEKLPTIKNWTASSEGTAAFESGNSQHKLYQAFETGEEVTLTIKLDESVYFEGSAIISNLEINPDAAEAVGLSVEFEGSGGITFTLPETVVVTIRSGVGGSTNPAGIIRATKGSGLTVVCIPAAGKTADKYGLNGATPSIAITSNTFTTADLNADTQIEVTFKDVE